MKNCKENIFLDPQGDFVDRGYYSLESFTRLLTLKAKYVQHRDILSALSYHALALKSKSCNVQISN